MFIIKEGTEQDKIGVNTDDSTKASIVNWLNNNGYAVRTTDEDKSFMQNAVQTEVNKMFANQKVQIEEKVKALTGIDRTGEGERAIDYLERAIKEKIAPVKELESQLEKLKNEGINGNEQAEQYKKDLELLQGKFADLSANKDKELEQLKSQIFNSKVRSMIDNELAALRGSLDESIDSKLLEDVIKSRLNNFYEENKAHQIDDTIIFKNKNGETIISNQDGKPKNAKELLTPYFEDIIDKKRKQNGAGSGMGSGGSSEGSKQKYDLPENVKTKVQLHEYLSKGTPKLDINSKEFSEAYSELGKELPLR